MNNNEIVGKWFDTIWGKNHNPNIIEELAHLEMIMQYPING